MPVSPESPIPGNPRESPMQQCRKNSRPVQTTNASHARLRQARDQAFPQAGSGKPSRPSGDDSAPSRAIIPSAQRRRGANTSRCGVRSTTRYRRCSPSIVQLYSMHTPGIGGRSPSQLAGEDGPKGRMGCGPLLQTESDCTTVGAYLLSAPHPALRATFPSKA
jgi:hypothetical protein